MGSQRKVIVRHAFTEEVTLELGICQVEIQWLASLHLMGLCPHLRLSTGQGTQQGLCICL